MRKMTAEERAKLSTPTKLATSGRNADETFGFVNVPPYRGSTVLYKSMADLAARKNRYLYGTHGSPSTDALEEAWNVIEGSFGTVLLNSGLAACTTPLLALLSAGDDILIPDSVYAPTRHFADGILKRMGIGARYYDPMIGGGIEALMQPNTKVVFTESPGSLTFEVQDIPAIAAAARKHGAYTVMDNTWATPLLFRPLDHGVDVSIQAGTKYPAGHSDVLIGWASCNERSYQLVKNAKLQLGQHVSADDVFLTLRGLRTMDLRLREQGRNALDIAHWLKARPEVLKVLHPALPDCPGHDLFKRDFKGASGVFSIVLNGASREQAFAFADNLTLFGSGASWGGFESLIVFFDVTEMRKIAPFRPGGPTLRLQIGLEGVDDIKADLDQAFKAMKAFG